MPLKSDGLIMDRYIMKIVLAGIESAGDKPARIGSAFPFEIPLRRATRIRARECTGFFNFEK